MSERRARARARLSRALTLALCCALAGACGDDPVAPAGAAPVSSAGGAAVPQAGTSAAPPTAAGSGAAPSAGQMASAGAGASDAPSAGAGAEAMNGAMSAADAGAAAPSDPAAADGGTPASGDAGSAAPADAGGELPATGPRLPPVDTTTSDGPFDTMQDLSGGPKGASGVFRPTELGRDGLKHPAFIWGCGGSSTPAQYADQLLRVASHGFIVIAEVAEIGDNGAPLRASIDWIIAENERADSPFYQKVDTSKIALGGHSIGSANSFFIADDPRLTTTIHVAGGSLDDVNAPFAETTGMGGKRLVHPVAYICSMSDTFGNVEKTEKDYDNTTVPAWMTVMTGVDHIAAARSGLPATIAWLRWHLGGETERRADFLDEGGEFTTGIFVSRSKNW